ncbi:MAG TPA: DUF4384 domain-containing protein [Longimicrobiaceae bacterium]|nr:DUF4384 domain-containing protein [Longimicrobiaceae bacterium]
MRNLFAALALLAASGAAGAAPARAAALPAADAPAAQAYDLRVRVWADDDRDLFRSGDRVRVQFHATRSAYVAVIHLTTDGEVEFLYPRSPWDDGYVRGGRNYSLPFAGGTGDWRVRGSPGIGYLYVVASEEPLDFRAFQNRSGSAWEYRRIGSGVRGDPYYALDRITELLVPDWDYGEFATDYYAYHVGSRHAYPRYACYDRYADPYSWGGYYDRCDRLVVLLRDDPYYYDPHRHRRARGYYLADSRRAEPLHRYKEPAAAIGRDYDRDRSGRLPPLRRTGGSARDEVTRTRPESRPRVDTPVLDRRSDYQQGQQPRQTEQERKRSREQEERRRDDERSRPVLERRPTDPETSRPRVTAPQREPQRESPPERTRSEAPPKQERPPPSDEGGARVRPEGFQ